MSKTSHLGYYEIPPFHSGELLSGLIFPYEEFFDVKFCPYQPLDQDAVFAAVSKKHV